MTADEKETISSLSQVVGALSAVAVANNGTDAYQGAEVAKSAVENNALMNIAVKGCMHINACKKEIAKELLDQTIKAGLITGVADQIINNIEAEDLEHLATLLLMGNDLVTHKYMYYLNDKYAKSEKLAPNDVPKLEGYPIPEPNRPITLTTPIVEKGKNDHILDTPIHSSEGSNVLPGSEVNVGDWRDNVLTSINRLPVPEPKKSIINGETYTSNPKHTLGVGGRSDPNAGIEPKNSFDLFERSKLVGKQRFTIDIDGSIHRFMNDNTNNGWHWAGSTSYKNNPLKLNNRKKSELKILYPDQRKNLNLR
ncbi:VENN motif pre-toxin domain-containing protein [Chelonobacter oris]|uniref:VENN motif pre-toxin domain-containing protein n=1 Tax=Chelonobacter oris TaxID=505317 RepID=UPI002447704A|nr:VENN motif pre-toxin domain-containing protein [Chelonobacter oris]